MAGRWGASGSNCSIKENETKEKVIDLSREGIYFTSTLHYSVGEILTFHFRHQDKALSFKKMRGQVAWTSRNGDNLFVVGANFKLNRKWQSFIQGLEKEDEIVEKIYTGRESKIIWKVPSFEQIIEQLDARDWHIRYAAVMHLAKVLNNNDDIIQSLKNMANDPDERVRIATISVLAKFSSESAVKVIVDLFQSDKNWLVREAAVISIGRHYSGKPLLDLLLPGLEDSDAYVRFAVIAILGDVGGKDTVQHLRPLLAVSDSRIQRLAAESLNKIERRNF